MLQKKGGLTSVVLTGNELKAVEVTRTHNRLDCLGQGADKPIVAEYVFDNLCETPDGAGQRKSQSCFVVFQNC